MKAVDVQVITYAPTVFYHCQHCELAFSEMGLGDHVHREQAAEALPSDLRADFDRLSELVHRLVGEFGPRLNIRVVDAASLEGFWKSLRYGARRYPAVIVDGVRRDARTGYDDLHRLIEEAMEVDEAPPPAEEVAGNR